ncbi:MAG TPA: S41 family peptidase [Blastocatellia bacterium]|nr:S41 family peptidase [Blastocatellia bacterium]
MVFRSKMFYIAVLAILLFIPASAFGQTKLLRFPDIHGDKVVFTYAGDLWIASTSGGTATRLTAHSGLEMFAKFWPDGKWIAFTGQYDGDEQVYVIPATGGEPKQLTYYPARGPLAPRWGYDNQVYGWTNDGKSVIFRSLRDSWTLPIDRLYTVPVTGGPAEPLPMPEAGSGAFSPDGSQMVYSPRFRDFRTEKRYSGGMANQLYIFNMKSYDAKRISEGERASRDPMWIGGSIYFNSDKDGHFNLYSYDVASGKTNEVTHNKTWDVRWPSSDRESRIVYELDGELQILDVKSQKVTPLSITVPDDGLYKRPSRISVAGNIEDVSLSPKGERVLIGARGDIFTVPIEKGPTRNLTHSSGAHDKWPRWSPDGSKIAFISDKSGEEEVYVIPQDGSGPAEQITKGSKSFHYAPEWSADGKMIAFGDNFGKLYVVTLADKSMVEIAHDSRGQIRDYTWSPKGHYLTFSMNAENGFSVVYIWSDKDKQLHKVTDDYFNNTSPVWDPQGNYLFIIGNHEFAPLISQSEFNYATNKGAEIYALALRKDVKNPFPPESDEVTITKDDSDSSKPADAKPAPKPPAEFNVDFDGLGARSTRVPVDPNNIGGLSAKNGFLLYVTFPAFYYGRQGDAPPALHIFSMKDHKDTVLGEGTGGYTLSDDGSKVLAFQQGGVFLFDAVPGGDKAKKPISLSGLMVDRVPTEEWAQIFDEVWRRYRDFFYVQNMHGFDWESMREQYRSLLPYVAHRSDLNYVISEMIAELTVQHAYIEGGDFQLPPRPRVALPGARFELDKASGKYRISKIFEGQNEEPIYRSPLTEVGVNAAVGDYVLAINGEQLRADEDPYKLLRNRADNPVQLTLSKSPNGENPWTTSYRSVTNESDLIYLNWVADNRRKVTELSGGKIGYIHVPDMGPAGIREFIKWYYPQLKKEALIIDDRANGGGNVSRMLIERLSRKALGVNFTRNTSEASTYPDGVFIGPMAALLNENSSSDGDIFPYMFRQAGLGPLIGKRSWGGVVGIRNEGPLIDGGTVFVPGFATASLDGKWVIEGHGVDPDIEVDNDPKSVIGGHDPQLERAVSELMKKISANPPKLPTKPADPVKNPEKVGKQ